MAHLHSVYDTDSHFSINPITRAIKNESSAKNVLIQGDHKSERFTFEIQRLIEGHDMSQCTKIEVHYINIDSKTKDTSADIYEVDDMQLSPESDDMVIFSWLIKNTATKYAGSLSFLIRFSCVQADGTIDYVWNTAIFTGISVSTGIYNSEIVVEQYSDVLEQWKQQLFGTIPTNSTSARIGEVTLEANDWVAADMENLYSQVVTIDGVTENSQIDLTPSVEQLAAFYEKDLAFVTENEDGVVTVYVIGQKPQNDYTIQVTITEVLYE